MSEEGKLKPCPFCGEREHLEMGTGEVCGRVVYCEICEAIGPMRNSSEAAKEAWNNRPAEVVT